MGDCLHIHLLTFQEYQLCARIMPGPLGVFFHLFHFMPILALWNKYYSLHFTKECIHSGRETSYV